MVTVLSDSAPWTVEREEDPNLRNLQKQVRLPTGTVMGIIVAACGMVPEELDPTSFSPGISTDQNTGVLCTAAAIIHCEYRTK